MIPEMMLRRLKDILLDVRFMGKLAQEMGNSEKYNKFRTLTEILTHAEILLEEIINGGTYEGKQ